MDAQIPVNEQYEQWGHWNHSPNQSQPFPYGEQFDFSGLSQQIVPHQWHQRQSSSDYGSSWNAQTPMTMSESSPTSLSRTTSWPRISSSSAWTSPLTSPQSGLPQVATPTFASTVPYLGCVSTPVSTGAMSARPIYTHHDNEMVAYNNYHPHQQPVATVSLPRGLY